MRLTLFIVTHIQYHEKTNLLINFFMALYNLFVLYLATKYKYLACPLFPVGCLTVDYNLTRVYVDWSDYLFVVEWLLVDLHVNRDVVN